MRNIIIRTLLLFIVCLCTACSQKGTKQKVSELIFNESITRAYHDGTAYTGEAWSDDGKSIRIIFKDGDVTLVEAYHANGQVALQSTQLSGSGKSFGQDGNAITMEEFVRKYPDLVAQVQQMVAGMLCSPEVK